MATLCGPDEDIDEVCEVSNDSGFLVPVKDVAVETQAASKPETVEHE